MSDTEPRPSTARLEQCLEVLAESQGLPADDPRFLALERAAAHLFKTAKKKRRLARRQARAQIQRDCDANTGRVTAYRQGSATTASLPATGTAGPLPGDRRCYICDAHYRELHDFYHRLCPGCAVENFAARSDRADLSGRRALITGGRIKIGFELARMLLRDGAHVRITTRFPADAHERFAACPESDTFGDRLAVDAIDFRNLTGVIEWIDALVARPEPLDILINNAAQTIRRPPAYYDELLQQDHALLDAPAGSARDAADRTALEMTQLAALFPAGQRDEEGRQLDLRPTNSWLATLAEVDPVEAVEVQVVNAIVPMLLNSRLEPALRRSPFADRYIVNVSAMEGVFSYANKTERHPHTNMAKAALNMMTRTSAPDYARRGIYMNSVDTGWVTQENPHPVKQRVEAAGFVPPLDVLDGAARVYAPILAGVRGDPIHGHFLKDFRPHPW